MLIKVWPCFIAILPHHLQLFALNFISHTHDPMLKSVHPYENKSVHIRINSGTKYVPCMILVIFNIFFFSHRFVKDAFQMCPLFPPSQVPSNSPKEPFSYVCLSFQFYQSSVDVSKFLLAVQKNTQFTHPRFSRLTLILS